MNKYIIVLSVGFLFASCGENNPDPLNDFPGKFVLGAGEIFMVDNTGIRQVTTADTTIYETKFHPEWSPDGQFIVYTYLRIDTLAGIYLINQDGTGNRILLGREEGSSWWRASISPDGKYLGAVRSSLNEGNQLEIYSLNESYKPVFLDVVECGTHLRFFQWSPDSKMIASVCGSSGGDHLSIYSIADGTVDDVSSAFAGGYMENASWSFQSDKIAFVLNEDIYVVNVDGSEFRNLTESLDVTESNVAWSPVFDELVFTEHGLMPDQISLLNFVSGEKDILFKAGWDDSLYESNFKWSASGDLLSLYVSGQVSGIHTIKREGGEINLIPDTDGQDFDWH